MRPRLVRDALNAALRKLVFPWLTPHPTSTGKETGYFQKTITDRDLYEMYKRNQLALLNPATRLRPRASKR
ncbi:MAG: hypothetical protein ACP5E9_07655 [Candidatus Methanospirareceae archaeon]